MSRDAASRVAPRAARAAVPALVLAAALLVPFLGKAFTIDDPLFLFQSRHLLVDPWHPTAFDVVWSTRVERMSAIMASGPGMAYLLLPSVALGGAEWAAHLVELAALWGALVATAALALRWGADARVARDAALVLAATPAVLGMAGTAMPDVPAMALGVWGVERTVAWSREGRARQGIAAALALAGAALFRSHLIVVVGIATAAVLGDVLDASTWRLRPWWRWAPLAAVPALVVAALAVTRDPASGAGAVAGAAGTFVFPPAIPRNLVAFFAHWVLVIPLGLPWVLLHPRRILGRPVVYLAAAAAWAYLHRTPDVGPVWTAAAAGIGAAVLWDVAAGSIRTRDGTLAMLALWLLTPGAVLPYLHLPSKYLLAAAPAAAIVVARAVAIAPRRRGQVVLAAAIVAGGILGLLILRADAAFGNTARRAANALIAPRVAAGETVWFNGHWGFQWYAENAGARPLTSTPPHPRWGDLVVSSTNAEDEEMGALLMRAMPRRRLVAAIEEPGPGGDLMNRRVDAGFFSNSWGYLPWAWERGPVDRYELWAIEDRP